MKHAFNLNLVQALPVTESMTDENLLFYAGSLPLQSTVLWLS